MNDTLIQNFQLRFRAGARLLTASLLTARDNLGGKGCALLVRSNFELLGGLQRVSTTLGGLELLKELGSCLLSFGRRV